MTFPRVIKKKHASLYYSLFAILLLAQMPDWKVLKDRDGNIYSIDKNRKIYTDAAGHQDYKPVSIHSLHYHLNLAGEMLKSHYPVKGIRIYQSILALPDNNQEVYRIKALSARALNQLKQRHGPRFHQYYESAQPFLYKQDDTITLLMPSMRYILKTKHPFRIIRKKTRVKIDYHYCGLLLGLSPGTDKSSYEMLIAIDTEIFPTFIPDVESYRKNWRHNILSDTFTRKTISGKKNKVLSVISHSRGLQGFSGYELVAVNKNRAYFVRIITATENFNKNKKDMSKIVKEFVIVK